MEPIGFGLGVAQGRAKASDCRLPMIGNVVLTLSVDLVANNSTVGTVTVSQLVAGVRTAVVTNLTATVYAVSHAATLAAIAVKIAALPGVASAVASADIITVVASPDCEVLLSAFVTTLGAGQPAFSYAHTSADTLLGVALFEQTIENSLTLGTALYPAHKAVNVMRRGAVYVRSEDTVGPASAVYWRVASDDTAEPIGGFTGTSDGNLSLAVTREFWSDDILAGAVGSFELSLP